MKVDFYINISKFLTFNALTKLEIIVIIPPICSPPGLAKTEVLHIIIRHNTNAVSFLLITCPLSNLNEKDRSFLLT